MEMNISINPDVKYFEQLNVKEGDTVCVYIDEFNETNINLIFNMLKIPFPNNTILILPKDSKLEIL